MAVPQLIDGLALPDLQDRLLCAQALEGFGPLAKSAAEALKKASADENKAVQEAAAKALKAVEKVVAAPAAPATPAVPAVEWKPGDAAITLEDNLEIGVRGSRGEVVR